MGEESQRQDGWLGLGGHDLCTLALTLNEMQTHRRVSKQRNDLFRLRFKRMLAGCCGVNILSTE